MGARVVGPVAVTVVVRIHTTPSQATGGVSVSMFDSSVRFF
jgi:hypothetical protein